MNEEISRIDDETIAITTTVNVPIQEKRDTANRLQQQIDLLAKQIEGYQAELDSINKILSQADVLNQDAKAQVIL